ncbi:aldo/keto reductase [Halorubrum lacusprofundi]|jgi:2,5-diketo-D-gluconate reductase B|uniref:Aldo/keto reductase n=1 Tax=Halorubrum lacusprofundi (strain ATCC 49239 / DSM 5036 / JCM 8891 / ACAM 34) TaxID=416348 RepID=B9LN24_HALLT|nr:aldo/keto reductase [Halorubrum lacusprofundi]ACM56762.1 aldo/keto reductase [Halorubrum lacusprofundi ATCC 49239]MCG1007757.1 aldo/keto reductase [Halorubrum lacusprofundi]
MPPLELPLGLGTSRLDDPAECRATVAAALEAGYRHVDTAQMYDNETAVGEGIATADVDRDDVVVATKIHPDNLAPADVRETARKSLDRLGLDRVDLLYVHWPTGAYDPDATLPAFDALREAGLTDHVGVSNFTPDLLREAAEILDAPIAAHQVECHPRFQQPELRGLAAEFDHQLVGYSPLARGDLFDDDEFKRVAERNGLSPAVLALAWALARGVTPIPKATGDHVTENRRAVGADVPKAALDAIDALEPGTRRIDPDDAAWNR